MLKSKLCVPNWSPVVLLLMVGEISGLYAFLYLRKCSWLLRVVVASLCPLKTFQFDLQIRIYNVITSLT
jgi:hypothetical protein